MEYTLSEDGGVVVVAFSGEIDLETSVIVREVLLDAIADADSVVVDLSAATTIDSSGIASLLEAYQTARKRGRQLMLAAIDASVMRVLKLARLDTVFSIAADVAAAKQAIGR